MEASNVWQSSGAGQGEGNGNSSLSRKDSPVLKCESWSPSLPMYNTLLEKLG